MRRMSAVFLLFAMLCLCACDTGPGINLRLFCERYNQASQGRARLDPAQFAAQPTDSGEKYGAYVALSEYIACEALPNGRIHTVTLTGLPETQQKDFYAAALRLAQAFAGLPVDQAERALQEIHTGLLPVLGLRTIETEGYRFSYAANEAGRYFRASRVRDLPPAPEPATLREPITE